MLFSFLLKLAFAYCLYLFISGIIRAYRSSQVGGPQGRQRQTSYQRGQNKNSSSATGKGEAFEADYRVVKKSDYTD